MDKKTIVDELQEEAEAFADEKLVEEKLKNQLLPEQAMRERLIVKFKEAHMMTELNEHISNAVNIIWNEGQFYLDAEQWQSLQEEMERAKERVEAIVFDPETMTFDEYLGLSNEAIELIELIGKSKFNESELASCLSLYAFLSTIKSMEPMLWYRLGIVLQECGDMERAIKAYDMSLEFNPENIGVYIFSAECCQELGKQGDADIRLEQAEKLIEEQLAGQVWLEPLSILKGKK